MLVPLHQTSLISLTGANVVFTIDVTHLRIIKLMWYNDVAKYCRDGMLTYNQVANVAHDATDLC